MSLGFQIDKLPLIDLPQMDMDRALFVLERNAPSVVWNTLATFENNPVTLAQTETIMVGHSVSGIRLVELDQVRRYAAGLHLLSEMIKNSEFTLTEDTACALHLLVGREEALKWGVFRTHPVHIHSVGYVPPSPSDLPALASVGFKALADIADTTQRAVAAFLWLSRTQFFYDCNKRTATLMMIGELVANGFAPLFVRSKDQEVFNTLLREFYESAEPTGMFDFFAKTAHSLYGQWEA